MQDKKHNLNNKQLIFEEMFVGTLIYAVVLGFFNDYTDIFYAKSFSTIFLCALVMQILTFLTFELKNRVIAWLKGREGFLYKFAMFFCVWLILFLSKFVYLWAIDLLFGSYVDISNFIGLIAIILSVTILGKLADFAFNSLGDS
jgi:hypothetical protein